MMSDTAEYWSDVKKHFSNKKVFTHKLGLDCGHYHVLETKKNADVDCRACIKIINDKKVTQ